MGHGPRCRGRDVAAAAEEEEGGYGAEKLTELSIIYGAAAAGMRGMGGGPCPINDNVDGGGHCVRVYVLSVAAAVIVGVGSGSSVRSTIFILLVFFN